MKQFTLFILTISVLLFIMGCGSSGSSTTTTEASEFAFKKADLDTVQGRWFATSFVLDGTETMPTVSPKIQVDIDSTGEWVVQVETLDTNKNTITTVGDSKNADSSGIEVLSYSYILTDNDTFTFTESYKDKATGLTHTILGNAIKDVVSSEYVGTYYLASLTLNGVAGNLSNVSDILTVESNGTVTETDSFVDGSNPTTITGHGAVQDGYVFLDYVTTANMTGTASLVNGLLSFRGKNADGILTDSTYNKMTGGELVGSYILKSMTFTDTQGTVISSTTSNNSAFGSMSFDSSGGATLNYTFVLNGVSSGVISDNSSYVQSDNDSLAITSQSGTDQFVLSWVESELKLVSNQNGIETVQFWQKIKD